MSVINIENVSFSYETHHVLHNVSINVDRGEFLAILGSNGAGKTTLLKIILDELKPTSGLVRIFGEELKKFKNWTKISYLSQSATAHVAGFPTTVFELVASNLHAELGLIKILNKSQKQRVSEVLELVGMASYKQRLFAKLSGGQMQKVLLARCLINNPEIIILDEPTSALDEKSAYDLFALLKRISHEKGTTIIASTHSQVCSRGYCDQVLNLDKNHHEEVHV